MDALASRLDDGSLPRALLIEVARQAIATTKKDGHDRFEDTGQAITRRLGALRPKRVLNATGVLLHTNLGRAPVAAAAAAAAHEAAVDFSPLEFDLDAGRRGGRGAYAAHLVASVVGAEDALVVNNNAGALFLTIAALAGGRATIVSRGELIEIGGSFRLPDLMAATGSQLVEVGTTNRTRVSDYRAAFDEDAALLLKVHPSNYRLEGFTEEASYRALGAVATEHEIPFVADIGSGLLDARVPWWDGPPPGWLEAEPAARQTLTDGADLVLFSGDKLLGGPQAGIVAGSARLIETLRRHPIARAVRIAGPQLASLTATLELYASGRGAEVPFWRMAAIPVETMRRRSEAVIAAAGIEGDVVAANSLPGAGSVPGHGIPTEIIRIAGRGEDVWLRLLHRALPIVCRRDEDALLVDVRAVDPEDDAAVADALAAECR